MTGEDQGTECGRERQEKTQMLRSLGLSKNKEINVTERRAEELTIPEFLCHFRNVRSHPKYDEKKYNHKNNVIRLALLFKNRGYHF